MFQIDPAFASSTAPLGELKLSHARLLNEARYPWIMLIPRLDGARELEDLSPDHRVQLLEEIVAAGAAVRTIGETLGRPVTKLNVGQLGNLTPQLHIHILGRRVDDPSWPGAAWGHSPPQAYGAEELEAAVGAARRALGL